jgi:predicted MPP superfamily phosphohydrolase
MKKKLDLGYRFTSAIVRKESLRRNISENLNLMYLSYFHFNKFGENLSKFIVDTIELERPDIILFGGDYVDMKNGLQFLETVFSSASKISDCFAIPGNHDYFFGVEKIKEIAKSNNVSWLEESIVYKWADLSIGIDLSVSNLKRNNIEILLLHEPIDIEKISDKYDLAFAGHLHGCQIGLWDKNQYSYPGALFYKNNAKKRSLWHGLYLISSGLGDTLPIRYNCSKDIILVDIN